MKAMNEKSGNITREIQAQPEDSGTIGFDGAAGTRDNVRNTSVKGLLLALTLLMSLPFSTMTSFAATAVDEENAGTDRNLLVGAVAAKADTDLTVQDMLVYAIQDEYAAQAEYDAIMAEYGVQRPFSNIIRSEQTHIDLLKPLFSEYRFSVPVNDAATRTVLPASLAESYSIGVTAEVDNIAMYESFLSKDLPADVREVFERLANASESHLKAFENAVSRFASSAPSKGKAVANSSSASISASARGGTRIFGGLRNGR